MVILSNYFSTFVERYFLCAARWLFAADIVAHVHLELDNFSFFFCNRDMQVLNKFPHLLDVVIHITHRFLQHFDLFTMLLNVVSLIRLSSLMLASRVCGRRRRTCLFRIEVVLKHRKHFSFDHIVVTWTRVDERVLLRIARHN